MSDSSESGGLGKWLDKDIEETIPPSAESPFSLDPDSIPLNHLQTSYRRLVLLYDLGRQICSETDDQRIFDTILAAVSKLLNVERAFIATLNQGNLVPRASYQIKLTDDLKSWPVSSTMLQRVIKEGISLLATDAMHDAKYGNIPSIDFHNIRSVICCPLGTIYNTRGLIYVDNRISSGAFSRSDLEFLNALSHYALLAVEATEERKKIISEKDLAEARWDAINKEIAATPHFVAVSPSMIKLYDQIKKVAQKDIPVMVVGETGTGKEVIARIIHECSPRARNPFIPLNIGSLSKSVVESELFGHEKGAFTGAEQKRIGKFELANRGTLFLDEVLDISPEIQPKLLRVLEQKVFERVGGNRPIEIDVRLVSACNKSPEEHIAKGLFREDLFYRLNSVRLEIPPLRNRREDILPLARYFLTKCGSEKTISEDALAGLLHYEWPGNVRELKNVIEALDAMVEGPVISKGDLPWRVQAKAPQIGAHYGFESLSEIIARVEKMQFLKALELAGGNNEQAIKLLGISRAKFFQRKKEFGL